MVVVAGRGRVGRSVAAALEAPLVAGRELPAGLGGVLAGAPDALVLLAVPDRAVAPLAAAIAAGPPPGRPAFAHLSGALGLEALAPLAAAGLRTGSLHPLQSFPRSRPPSAFAGITFAVDADEEGLLAELERLARRLGGVSRRVGDADRALYHAAATLAGGLVALAAEACRPLRALGWSREEALAALLPLLRGALDSLEAEGLPSALSGPVRRGDAGTVRRHLAALPEAGGERLLPLYRILGLAALDLAGEAGLGAGAASELRTALGGSATT